MKLTLFKQSLLELKLESNEAQQLTEQVTSVIDSSSTKKEAWQIISKSILPTYPFPVHLSVFSFLFPEWNDHPEYAPVWIPTQKFIETTNLYHLMSQLEIQDTKLYHFHHWSYTHYQDFWRMMIKKLTITFKNPISNICDLSLGVENPRWFPDVRMNIADSCFNANGSATAILYPDENNKICQVSYDQLNVLSNQIANSLLEQGFGKKDAIAIIMPMTHYAVAIYLGIIKMGGIVVSIPDSFSPQEIATRLKIADTKAIFSQDYSLWDGKKPPLYEKIIASKKMTQTSLPVIVLSCKQDDPEERALHLQDSDCFFTDFLSEQKTYQSTACDPMDACHILFSSGTTAEPKAIVWNHTTPIKAASDAYLHHNIQINDRLAWPTNLGWMMGPWLIYAALINKATMVLYPDVPKNKVFGQFVQDAKVTMLGVVPTLVASWRHTHCMENLDWSSIKAFSSTGECSNPEDMFYLMSLAHYQPVLEYCGGTEIGGAYLSSTMLEENYPSLFSTPTMGLNICILNEEGKESNKGEVAIIPPSIGLSIQLLNGNHHQVYFANMPQEKNHPLLRRHGDQVEKLANHYYRLLGRIDDSMNLGGIKTSAVEIERTLANIPGIDEVAAIAVSTEQGPSQLVIYIATSANLDKSIIKNAMQQRINKFLNPLFKIDDIVFVKELPKTASNKIMRRVLREAYVTQY